MSDYLLIGEKEIFSGASIAADVPSLTENGRFGSFVHFDLLLQYKS